MSKVLWNNKSLISLERVEWFSWFFACSYLHLIGYPLKLPKFWTGIVRHRLSANQLVRCFKLKKHEGYMRYQVDFLLPLKLQKILCYFGLCRKILLVNRYAGFFTFDLFDLFNRDVRCLKCSFSSSGSFGFCQTFD